MRRTLAGLLFGIAYTCASLAVGGWLLQRTAFNPNRTAGAAQTVLGDERIREQVVELIAQAAAPTLGVSPAAVSDQVNKLITDPATAAPMARQLAEILHDAHAHLIGEQRAPVQITDVQMRNIVRRDEVIGLPPIVLPVPEIGVLSVARQVLRWLVPIAAIAALVFGLVGLTAHPERSTLLRSLGFGLLFLAVLIAVLGYVVPRFVVPALNKSAWARVPARLADDTRPLLIAIDLALLGAGVALLAGSGLIRRRRRWSTPVSTYRYNEERHWS